MRESGGWPAPAPVSGGGIAGHAAPPQRGHAGQHLHSDADALLVDVEPRRHDSPGPARGTVMVDDPAVTARVDGDGLPLGERTSVRLETADPSTRTVRFTYPA